MYSSLFTLFLLPSLTLYLRSSPKLLALGTKFTPSFVLMCLNFQSKRGGFWTFCTQTLPNLHTSNPHSARGHYGNIE